MNQYHLLVPVGTLQYRKKIEGFGCAQEKGKEKEREKGREGNRVIDRIVRSFEIRTKPSTHSNDQFGICLSSLISTRNPEFRFDSCFLSFLSIEVLIRVSISITCLQFY
jgi:hypothetical protein